MVKPVWTLDSNTSLGTFQERTTLHINLQVFDPTDRSTVETSQFENHIDSTIVNNYADEFHFWIRSNGLAQTPWLGAPPGYDQYSPRAQSYVFKIPRQSQITETANHKAALGFVGVAIDGVPFKSPNSGKTGTIGGVRYTENAVIFPVQEDSTIGEAFTDGSGVIGSDRRFYYHTDPQLLYSKTPGQHSPIVGYAFDGNPIYGPYGYVDPTDINSGVKIIETSYRLSEVQRANGTVPDGSFIEDFVYQAGLGDLDQYNGRFCKTPEYPNGIYAYFITIDPDDFDTPKYPYIVGPRYFNEPVLPNGDFEFPGDITVSVLSGSLPPGARVENLSIVGTPFEVAREKIFRFVLRAQNVDGITDRTFSTTIQGADAPVWVTPEGDLPVGTVGERIETISKTTLFNAVTGDTSIRVTSTTGIVVGSVITLTGAGNSIDSNTVVLAVSASTKNVRLSKPLLGPVAAGTSVTFTYTIIQENLFVLDNDIVDFQLSAIDNDLPTGQKLTYYIPPRGGELPPGLTLSSSGRITGFPEALIANDTGDGTNGNYDMNFYDRFAFDYGVRPNNGFDSFLYDNQTYDYSDAVRSPRKLNRYYQFIVRATDGISFVDRRFRIYVVGDDHLRADNTIMRIGTNTFTADVTFLRKPIWITPKNLGRRRANNYVTVFLDIYDPATLQGTIGYVLDPVNDDGSASILPPGMVLDQLSGEIYGSVPYQPAVTRTYKFTVRAIRYGTTPSQQLVSSSRTFSLDIIGEVDSTIAFITPGDLGTIAANFISELSVVATTTVPKAVLKYSLIGGKLPPGLTLVDDGTIQGKVNQFATAGNPGLTTFDNNTTIFDKFTTSVDREYTFIVLAKDQFEYSATSKVFKISVSTPNDLLYSNVFVKPFLKLDKRLELTEFFTNPAIFERDKLYRPGDPAFGVQTELKMLLYAGIETKEAAEYVKAFGRASRKRYRFGSVKKAIAKTPGTNEILYEAVYVEIFDNQENTLGSLPDTISVQYLNYPVTVNQGSRDVWDSSITDNNITQSNQDVLLRIPSQDKIMRADSDGQLASDSNRSNVFGSSTTNIRKKISEVGDTERNFLPLWMRTPQSRSGIEQGFTKAVVICYCRPQTQDDLQNPADRIMNNIKNSGFDFKSVDFTVDRAIIDSVEGEVGDKYLVFAAREVING